jgi:hypothetical protein
MNKAEVIVKFLILAIAVGLFTDTVLSDAPNSFSKTILIIGLPAIGLLDILSLIKGSSSKK